jgi:hypothetical protein
MITHITHAGVLHVEDVIQHNHPTLLISILDANSPLQRPNFSKFHNALSLTFKDRCEEDYGLDYNWIDEPDAALNFDVLRVPNERLFSLSDAVKIEFNLIVHCKSGVGRSAAIAEFFGIIHNIPFKGTDPQGRFLPNCRVTRLLTKAYHAKYGYEDSRDTATKIQQLGVPKAWYPTSGF